MEPWVQIVSQVGFPIGITIFWLVGLQKWLVSLDKRMEAMTEVMRTIGGHLGTCANCPMHGKGGQGELHQWAKELATITGGEK